MYDSMIVFQMISCVRK